MVVAPPSIFTALPEATDATVLGWLRVWLRRGRGRGHELLEAPAHASEIGVVVRREQRQRLEAIAAGKYVKLSRKNALELRELIGVCAELEHGAGLRLARQLGVHWLVMMWQAPSPALDLTQKIWPTHPTRGEQGSLVNQVGAGAHGGERRSSGFLQSGRAHARLDLDDLPAPCAQRLEDAPFVLQPALLEQTPLDVVLTRTLQLAIEHSQLEPGEVLARQEVADLRRRKADVVVGAPH